MNDTAYARMCASEKRTQRRLLYFETFYCHLFEQLNVVDSTIVIGLPSASLTRHKPLDLPCAELPSQVRAV